MNYSVNIFVYDNMNNMSTNWLYHKLIRIGLTILFILNIMSNMISQYVINYSPFMDAGALIWGTDSIYRRVCK